MAVSTCTTAFLGANLVELLKQLSQLLEVFNVIIGLFEEGMQGWGGEGSR